MISDDSDIVLMWGIGNVFDASNSPAAPALLGDSIVDDLTGGSVEMGHFGCFIFRFCVNLWGDGVDTCIMTSVDNGYGATTLPARPCIDNGIARRLMDEEGRQMC